MRRLGLFVVLFLVLAAPAQAAERAFSQRFGQTGCARYVLKSAIATVMIESGTRRCHQKDVHPAIIVIVEESASTSEGFNVPHRPRLLWPAVRDATLRCDLFESDAIAPSLWN